MEQVRAIGGVCGWAELTGLQSEGGDYSWAIKCLGYGRMSVCLRAELMVVQQVCAHR